ncbi:hypothetical protein RQP46_006552 [Phenoliferia psychrophenolica]
MRQSTLANGSQGLEVADSPPHASSSAAKKRRNEPVRHAFATQPDPDELQDGESLDEDEDDEDPTLTVESPVKSRHSTSAAAAVESEGEDSSDSSATTSSDESVVVVPTPKKKDKKKAARAPTSSPVASRAVTPVVVLSDDSEDEDDVPIVSSMLLQHKPNINMFDDEAEEASDLSEEERGVAPRRVGQGKRARPSSQMVISSDNSDDEELTAPPSSRDARKAKLESMQKKKRKAPSPTPSSPSSSSDSDRPAPSSSKRKSSNPPKRRKRASSSAAKKSYARDGGRRSADEASNSDVDDFIDDDDSLLGEGSESSRSSSPPAKGKGKGKAVVRGGKDKGRRAGMSQKQKGKRRAVESDSGTNDEDDDDLELSGKETVLPERLRKSSPRRSQLLKKRKATYMGAESPPESESESASASGNASDGSDGSDDSPKKREDLDADLSDFLEEDDEEEVDDVVAKHRENMTRKAQGQKLHVKTFLQYLVHLIVCPTVDWYKSDENFAQSYDRVTRDLEGMTSSLIGSNAWRKGFKRAIDERPSFQMDDIDPSLVGASCDACTMGAKRHSKFTATTSGKRYDPKTFKDLPDNASTHSDDSDSDDVAETDDGKTHNLGEFCAGRAEVYHDLRHWAWEAYQDLKGAVKPIKTKYPKLKKATREEKKEREDLLAADADRVAVALDESGKIKSLAEGLERMIDSATKNFAIK